MSVFATWFGTRSFLFIGRKSARRRHALRDARRGILFGFYFPPQLVVDCIVFVPEETECFAVDKIFRQIYSFSRFLSNVLICSRSTTEFFTSRYFFALISMCVGSFALFILDVIAAQITVGLCLFPTSFWITSTGRKPPCSEPITGIKSA